MNTESLKIKTKTKYDWDDIVYVNDFDVNLLEIIKIESRIGAKIYYIGYVLNTNYDYNTINPLYFVINRLFGYIEKIEGSNDRYLVVSASIHNNKMIRSFNIIWKLTQNKITSNNFNNKIKGYDKLRFNSDIDLHLDTLIEFRLLVINVSCVFEKDNEYYPEIYLDECLYVKDDYLKEYTLKKN